MQAAAWRCGTAVAMVAMVLACLCTAASADISDAGVGGAKSAGRGCSIVGKWRLFDNSEHVNFNMTITFVADGTYLSNVDSKSFPCHCVLSETGVWSQSPAQTDLVLTSKACHSSDCCSCETGPVTYDLKYTASCNVVYFVIPDQGATLDFKRVSA